MCMDSKLKPIKFEDEFSKRLEIICEELELKQEVIASSCYCTRQSVSNYINGKRAPDAEFLWRFCKLANEEYVNEGYGDFNTNYLLGLTNERLFNNFNANKELGLNGEAIKNLKNIKNNKQQIDLLNDILSNENLVEFLDDFNHTRKLISKSLNQPFNDQTKKFQVWQYQNALSKFSESFIKQDTIKKIMSYRGISYKEASDLLNHRIELVDLKPQMKGILTTPKKQNKKR